MSQENIEIVRRAYEVLNNRDFSRVDEDLDPEIEIDVSRNLINPGVYRGHAGFERMVRATDEVWENFHTGPRELTDAGDHVVSRSRSRARAAEAASSRRWTCSTS